MKAGGPSRITQSQPVRSARSTASAAVSTPAKMQNRSSSRSDAAPLAPLHERLLRVEVDERDALAVLRRAHGKGRGERRLAGSALGAGDSYRDHAGDAFVIAIRYTQASSPMLYAIVNVLYIFQVCIALLLSRHASYWCSGGKSSDKNRDTAYSVDV